MIRQIIFSLMLLLILPSLPQAHANDPISVQQIHPAADLWKAVRQREGSEPENTRTQVRGVESNILINKEGEDWQHYRMQQLIPIAAKVLGFLLIAILVFRLVRGKIPIGAGRSQQHIKRFTGLQRFVHWVTAILFIGLAVSGIALLFGRYIVIPVFGSEIGGSLMYYLKRLHDFSGPAFGVSLLAMVLVFMKGNLPSFKTDIMWVLKGGGMLGGGHPSAGRYNAGEKGWFWMATLVGAAVVVSGLVLDFPNFEQTRNTMQFYHWIHSIAAVAIMAGAMGHIYMGTIAMEGAFECMKTGYCDANWAKEHHDLWYEDMKAQGKVEALNTPAAKD